MPGIAEAAIVNAPPASGASAPATPPATPPALPAAAPVAGAPAPVAPAAATPGVAPVAGAPAAAPVAAAIVYDLKAPADSPLPAEHIAAIKTFAEAHQLPANIAQAIVDRDHAQVTAQNKAWKDVVGTYETAVRNDPALGGQKFDATMAAATKVLTQFGSPALIEALHVTGLGSHPELVRMLAAVGARIAEPVHITSTPPTGRPKTLADALHS